MDKPPLVPIAVAGGAIVLLIAGGAWWMLQRPAAPAQAPKAVNATEAAIPAPPAPAELPPIDQMDPVVRALVGALSNRPELAKWLATDSLVRQLAAAIDAASQGRSYARDLKVLAPTAPFAMVRRNNRRTIDPASYRRYNGLVDTVTSIDASAAAKVYKTIRPRLNEAYRNHGHPDGDVDRALAGALDLLLDTPVLKDPMALTEGPGARWAFADPHVEALTASQKQLLRMGPAHVETLLTWLRAFQARLK